MSEVIPFQGPLLFNGDQRQHYREVKRAKQVGDLTAVRHNSRIDVIESVTHSAMLATAHLSALENYLIAEVPHAEGRLRHLADGGCMAMTNAVMRLSR